MSVTLRLFVVAGGHVTVLPKARWERVWRGERWPERANTELLMLETVVTTEERRAQQVHRVLPIRELIGPDGALDRDQAMRAGKQGWSFLHTPEDATRAIARLQWEASHFWEPTPAHLAELARLLGVPVAAVERARCFRPGSGAGGRAG
jgi:hypothetical protein